MDHGNQRPEIELVRAFMPVLVTSNFDDDSIKTEWASMETPFSHYKYRWSVVRSGRVYKGSDQKQPSEGKNTIFPIIMGAFCCHGHQSFDPICLKTLCSLSPLLVMLHIKFGQDWPTGLRDIQVRKYKIFVIREQVTPKWAVWSGPKSNSYELLCLSWLPATLMIIRTKRNELAWRPIFPIISLWKILRRSRAARLSISYEKNKQVAQRATIAHLSPVCQGQISFKYKLF